ncbi:unnamed protein product [Mytilus coruscus]|uniref:Uncharacterized protein n=1 Tax=Mytilus coruscus TaxID=42192 RepID=A0A6J8AX46_MYTCO|nr:unnamed protein product [Mytilus coruscus]
MLHVIFSTGVTTDLHNNDSSPNMVNIPVRWNNEMKDQFVNLVEDKLSTEDLFKKLVTLNVESDRFQKHIDNFVESFNSIFIDSAHKCFGDKVVRYNQPNRQNKNKVFQPWFDKNCHQKRDEFHKAKRKRYLSKTDEYRANLKYRGKAYKSAMGKVVNDFQFRAEKDLRSASEGEPRELWNILNNLNKSTSKRDGIGLDDFASAIIIKKDFDDSRIALKDMETHLGNTVKKLENGFKKITTSIQDQLGVVKSALSNVGEKVKKVDSDFQVLGKDFQISLKKLFNKTNIC